MTTPDPGSEPAAELSAKNPDDRALIERAAEAAGIETEPRPARFVLDVTVPDPQTPGGYRPGRDDETVTNPDTAWGVWDKQLNRFLIGGTSEQLARDEMEAAGVLAAGGEDPYDV